MQEQVLHRRVGQHDAQLRQTVGKAGGERRVRPLAHEHDGPLRPREHAGLLVAHLAHLARVVDRGGHHGERLALAPLARAQLRHRLGAVRIAHEVEAAKPLHRHDAALCQQPRGAREDRVALLARRAPGYRAERRRHVAAFVLAPAHLRAARKACVGLGVEATVEWIAVFGGAPLAQGEVLHGRAGAIVGQLLDDGEARAAVRAVDERIAIAAVVGVEQFARAIVAGGKVGRHERGLLHGGGVGKADLERVETLDRHLFERDFLHARGCRRVLGQLEHELVEQLPLAFRMGEHAVGGVEHPAVHEVLLRHAVDEGAKAHPLHDALHLDVERFDHSEPPLRLQPARAASGAALSRFVSHAAPRAVAPPLRRCRRNRRTGRRASPQAEAASRKSPRHRAPIAPQRTRRTAASASAPQALRGCP